MFSCRITIPSQDLAFNLKHENLYMRCNLVFLWQWKHWTQTTFGDAK